VHWANHVRPQRWANNPPGKEERKKEDFVKITPNRSDKLSDKAYCEALKTFSK